jgi:putative ABC transport system substrate-binding protein
VAAGGARATGRTRAADRRAHEGTENEPVPQVYSTALREGLRKLGWIDGRKLRFDAVRFYRDDPDRMRAYAAELVKLAPDVIVVAGAAATRALQQQTRTIPIVFVAVGDPVASGIVGSIARPEGNTTGFTNLSPSVAGKWPELLKDAAPRIARVAVIFNPEFPVSEQYIASIEAAAAALAVKAIRTPADSAAAIERAIDALATEPNGGLIIVPPPPTFSNRELINRLAVQHRLPTIYDTRDYAAEGGLMSYGPDIVDLFRLAASYADRILLGAKSGELPVQFPTTFHLVVNLRTVKAIGLTIPEAFLLRADELLE